MDTFLIVAAIVLLVAAAAGKVGPWDFRPWAGWLGLALWAVTNLTG